MFNSMKPVYHIDSHHISDDNDGDEYRFSLGKPDLKGTAIIIDDEYECQYACERIKEYCIGCPVVGFDAEWLPQFCRGVRSRVALLQVATPQRGDVFLFRLNVLRYVPDCLRAILEDRNIIKVGVSPNHDRDNLEIDYNVNALGILDLRLLCNTMKGLVNLALDVLGVHISKGFVTVSNWEQNELSLDQIRYAATDAYACVEIFKKWVGVTFDSYGRPNKPWHEVESEIGIDYYVDVVFRKVDQVFPFIEKRRHIYPGPKSVAKECAVVKERKIYRSDVYASDDTFLWNVEKENAEKLVREGKGEIVSYTVRLYKDSQDPPTGDAGIPKPSLIEKASVTKGHTKTTAVTPSSSGTSGFAIAHLPLIENLSIRGRQPERCVVCGSVDNLVKKNIVPKSFSKYFPEEMAVTSHHDVLSFCVQCERKSQAYVSTLTDHFRYVLGWSFVRKNIEEYGFLIDFLSESELWETDVASCISTTLGKAVVVLYEMNNVPLTRLEKLWREMFVESMNPQFLPKNWSVD